MRAIEGRVRGAALLLLATGALCGAARAGEEKEKRKLEVLLENREDGAAFGVRGGTMPLPEGTRLEVQLAARGKTKDMVCALFRVDVAENAFSGGEEWGGRTLAPLAYEVQISLDIEKQSKSVRRWLMEAYGFAPKHRELLETRTVEVGSVEEQAEFAKANLEKLLQFATDLETLRQEAVEAVAVPAAENAEWRKTLGALNGRVLQFRREFDGYVRGYVVLLEKGFIEQLLKALKVIGGGLYAHHKGRDGAHASMQELERRIARIAQHIRDRLPTAERPLVHPDAAPEEDEPEQPHEQDQAGEDAQ